MIGQQPELASVEEAGVNFLYRASKESREHGRTARRSAPGSQRALQLIVVTAIGLAVAFMIISCIRHITSQRAVQTQVWRQLAGSEEGDNEKSCNLDAPSDTTGQPQQDTEEVTDANQQPERSPLGATERGGQQQQEQQEQQDESKPGAAEGGRQQQEGESGQGGLEQGGKQQEQQSRDTHMPGSAGSESDPNGVTPNAPGAASDGSTSGAAEFQAPGPSAGEAVRTSPRGSGKRKAKTKHLEEPVQKYMPPKQAPESDSEDMDESEDELPTRWPQGVLYGPRVRTLPVKHEPRVAKVRVMPTKRPPQQEDRRPRAQLAKVKALTGIAETVWEYAEQTAGTGSEEEIKSAAWLLGEVVQALGVQVDVARRSGGGEEAAEIEEACALAEAACAVANEFLSEHPDIQGGLQPKPQRGSTESERSSVAVRLLVLKLAQTRLEKALDDFDKDPHVRRFPELEKFADMATTLIAGTVPLPERLRAEKQYVAAHFVTVFLGAVQDLAKRVEDLLALYGGEEEPPMDLSMAPEALSQALLGAMLGPGMDAMLGQLQIHGRGDRQGPEPPSRRDADDSDRTGPDGDEAREP